MIRIFYHNDLDGRCSAAIAMRNKELEAEAEAQGGFDLIEIDYTDEVPVWKIRNGEPVFILDFSFKPDVMEQVMEKTQDITWIDHHKTATYDYGRELKGLRDVREKMFSACELTWMYFYRDKQMPDAVKFIGDRDKWAWKYRKDSEPFNLGMRAFPHLPQDNIWNILFVEDIEGNIEGNLFIDKVQRTGETCKNFRDNLCYDYMRYGFECWLEYNKNHYLCFARGIYFFGSEGFGKNFEKYDICISFEFDGEKHVIGLYSSTVDVAEIAKSYGGGGHKGASGFLNPTMPFRRIKWCVDTVTNKVGEIEQEKGDEVWIRGMESDTLFTTKSINARNFKSLAEASEYAETRTEGVSN